MTPPDGILLEPLMSNPMLPRISECDFNEIRPIGNNALVIKDGNTDITEGGVILPAIAQDHKRRGWVLAVGGGVQLKGGTIVPPSYEPGDYVLADRHYSRPDEAEDEIFQNPSILLVKGEEIVAIDRGIWTPDWVWDLIERYGNKEDLKQVRARRERSRGHRN